LVECGNEEGISTSSTSTLLTHPPAEVRFVFILKIFVEFVGIFVVFIEEIVETLLRFADNC
jgi:hypothetical protein